MTPDLFSRLESQGAAVNLSARAKLCLTGADRVRYLNGQVTNDVRKADREHTLYACVTDVKGRIAADVFVHASADSLLLDAEAGLREPLGMRLERYIVADDVELTDVTDGWQLWHVFGPGAAGALHSNRFGTPGVDLWVPAGEKFHPSQTVLSEEEAEAWRIWQKIPRWPNELNDETFPPEAGLTSSAMDFAKGCYIGQEILSRIKTTGKMPRQLLAWECTVCLVPGTAIHNAEGRPVGVVTSSAMHPEHGFCMGLAYVKQGTAPDGLTADGAPLKPR